MSIRKTLEDIEKKVLHPKACLSSQSRGRLRPEPEDDVRTCFQRDRDRIIHSKAFRRLKHKTQVFLAPQGDHYRTRLTHVLEVSQIARTIARALRLNEDLTEAIALGHDLGHTPFGHAGEAALREVHPGGFDHYVQSLRVVDVLEKDGKGLNLTMEVRDGIVKHSKGKGKIVPESQKDRAITLEGQVVRIADIIAYVNHDLDDALRAGVIKRSDIPSQVVRVLGESYSKRIDTAVKDVIKTSLRDDLSQIKMGDAVSEAVYILRDFLFERVYESDVMAREFRKTKKIIQELYSYYLDHPEEILKKDHRALVAKGTVEESLRQSSNYHQLVCDFIAGMTDRFALSTYERLFLPQGWTVF
jgi:dGTPase